MDQQKTTKLQSPRKFNVFSKTSKQENEESTKKHSHAQSTSEVPSVNHNFEQNDKDNEINLTCDTPAERQTAETSDNTRASITSIDGQNNEIETQPGAKSTASDESEDAEVFERSDTSTVTKRTSPSRLPVPLQSRIRPASVSLPISLDAYYSSNEDLTKFMSPKLPRSGKHRIKKPEISLPKLWDFKRNSTESIHTIKEKSDDSPKSNSPKANNGKTSMLPRPITSDQEKPPRDNGNVCYSDLNTLDTSEECLESSNKNYTQRPNDIEDRCDKLKSNFDNLEEPHMVENNGGSPIETPECLRTTVSNQTDVHTSTAIATAELREAPTQLNSLVEAQKETFEVRSVTKPFESGTSKSKNNHTDTELHDKLTTSMLAEVKDRDIEEPHVPASVLEYDITAENTSDIFSTEFEANMTEDIQDICMSDAIKSTVRGPQENDHESLQEHANIRENIPLSSGLESADSAYIESLNVVTYSAHESEHQHEEMDISLDSQEVISESADNQLDNELCVRVKDVAEESLHEFSLRRSDSDTDNLEVLEILVTNDVQAPRVNGTSDTEDNQHNDKTREKYHTEINVVLDNNVSGSQLENDVASEVNGSVIPKHAANESDKATKYAIFQKTIHSEVLEKDNHNAVEEIIALSTTSDKEIHDIREVETLPNKELRETIETSSVKGAETSIMTQQNEDKFAKHGEHLAAETTETDIEHSASTTETEYNIHISTQSGTMLQDTSKESSIENIVEDEIQIEQATCEESLYENSYLDDSETNQSVDREFAGDTTDVQVNYKHTTDDEVDENQAPSVVRKYIPYVIPLGMGIVGAWIWFRHK